jgi:hypothetical protein
MIRADTTARPAFASMTIGICLSGCGNSSAAVSKRQIVRTPSIIDMRNTTPFESLPVSFRTFRDVRLQLLIIMPCPVFGSRR